MKHTNGLGEYWWDKSVGEDSVHQHITSAVKWLDDNQAYRTAAIQDAVSLYNNRDTMGLSGSDYARAASSAGDLKLNLVKSVVDTLVAHISTNKTRPMFLTSRGKNDVQERAKKLNRFAAGQLYQTRFYSKIGPRVFRDACLFGKGLSHFYAKDANVAAERVFPGDILIDDIEARDAEPRQMFRHREVAREILIARYPKAEKAILDGELIRNRHSSRTSKLSDPISVVEAWHLPSKPGAKDGRHTLTTSAGALFDERYERNAFPFAWMDWTDPLLGWWPTGLVHELDGLQVEINYILQKVQKLMTLATSQVWVQKGSKVNTGRMSNQDWGVNEYEGTAPLFMAVQAVSPEYFSHLDRLWSRGFEIAGISQLAAQAKKPGGIDSAVALREFKDSQTQRFLDVEQAYEKLHLDAVEQMIHVAKEIDETEEGGYQILAKGSRDAEIIRWEDVDLDRDSYVLQAYPTNMLPSTPAGKIQTAKEFGDAFPEIKPHLLSLFDFPDLDAAVSTVNSAVEFVEMLLSEMLDHGRYHPPEPMLLSRPDFMSTIVVRMSQRYLRAKIDGVPEDRLQLVLNWLEQAQAAMQQAAPPPAAPPPAPMGDPSMGVPPMGPPLPGAVPTAA